MRTKWRVGNVANFRVVVSDRRDPSFICQLKMLFSFKNVFLFPLSIGRKMGCTLVALLLQMKEKLLQDTLASRYTYKQFMAVP